MKWQTAQLKYVARFSYGDALTQAEEERDGPIKVFGSNGPYANFSKANTKAPAIVIGRKGSYGKVNWSNEPCFASDTTFYVDSSTTKHNLRWLYYTLQTLRLDEGSSEAAVPGLNRENAYANEILVPPFRQQRAIADYLDRATAKIDTLIAAKQRLLDLLAEKRRALITHAVTRGLDATGPLRDSGVEWLGEIPRHWEIISLKMLAEVRTGVAKGRTLDSTVAVSVPYLRVANVQDGYLDLSDVAEIEVLPHEIPAFSLQKGDVLMNEGGDADKLGRGAVWDGSIEPCLHQNHVFAVRCFRVGPRWLSTVTDSNYAKAYFESRAKQSTNLASISATNLKELPVPMPPQEEQRLLMQSLEKSSRMLDRLIHISQDTIKLLHERRIALIAAAVTGKFNLE